MFNTIHNIKQQNISLVHANFNRQKQIFNKKRNQISLAQNQLIIRELKSIQHPLQNIQRYSTINQLKKQALLLQNQTVKRLGKQNMQFTQQNKNIPRAKSNIQNITSSQNRKKNYRKIIKGRPQMYAVIKKRKIIQEIIENKQKQIKQNINRQTLNQLFNRNNLLKFITTAKSSLHKSSQQLANIQFKRKGSFNDQHKNIKINNKARRYSTYPNID